MEKAYVKQTFKVHCMLHRIFVLVCLLNASIDAKSYIMHLDAMKLIKQKEKYK